MQKRILERTLPALYEIRDAGDAMPTLTGYLAVFNEWTEINSVYEGHFLERIASGATSKTIRENRNRIKVTFNHGQDPHLGDKVLGPIAELEEDGHGTRYAVPLLDTSYNRDLLPGLQANLYGSSFRFRVHQERFDKNPQRSEHNPDGIPERTIKELALYEFGPVTYPAYPAATAGVRSTHISAETALRRIALLERTF